MAESLAHTVGTGYKQSMTEWLKRSWAHLLLLLGVALAALAALFKARKGIPVPEVPPPPVTPSVPLPQVDSTPSVTYTAGKVEPVNVTQNGVGSVIDNINKRHE